jgi:hypothetical protein
MAIKVKSSISEKKEFEKGLKASDLIDGDYEVEVLSTRLVPASASYEDAYYIDLRLLSAPAGGEEFVSKKTAWCKYMGPYKNKPTKTGGVFTAKQQQTGDEEAVQIAFGALFGFERADAGNVSQEDFDAGFDSGNGAESPAVGKRAIYRVKSYKKDGQTKRFGDLLPLKADGAAAAVKAASPKAAPKAPPPPSKAAKPSFEQAAKDAGFEPRSDFPGWFYNESTEEQLDTDDLKAKLGY